MKGVGNETLYERSVIVQCSVLNERRREREREGRRREKQRQD